VDFDVVVVDNHSRWPTRLVLLWNMLRGRINRLCLLDENTLYARGNNTGGGVVPTACTHVLLLNSDVRIRRPGWLRALLDVHQRGSTGLGVVTVTETTAWADGWCLLIDADLFQTYRLDERFEWYFSPARLQANLLRDGYSVRAVARWWPYIRHFGHGSGPAPRGARGMDTTPAEIETWFEGRRATVVESLGPSQGSGAPPVA
jgi:GT2 family glycosyltransferase